MTAATPPTSNLPAIAAPVASATPETPETPITPIASAPSAPVPPMPFNPQVGHPLDSSSTDTVITKTSPTGFSVSTPANPATSAGPHLSDGNAIATADPLMHLPVGATLTVGVEGPSKIVAVLPATAARGPFAVMAASVHKAIEQLWAVLVKEGHAVVADIEKL